MVQKKRLHNAFPKKEVVMTIEAIIAREIFDSRGLPALECELVLCDGTSVTASVPSGLSRGKHEAHELRDGGSRLMGKGVLKAIKAIEKKIAPRLIGHEPNVVQADVMMIELDDTDDKSKLGANAILAVSMAVCRAQALVEGSELYEMIAYLCDFDSVILPCPMFNMINGGMHANSPIHVQEFMLMPTGLSSFRASMELGSELFYTLKKHLEKAGRSTARGDEGGFIADFRDEQEALDMLAAVIEETSPSHEGSVMIALDVAASRLFNPSSGLYTWYDRQISADELIEWYAQLAKHYPLYSIEDGLAEDDWDGWQKLFQTLGGRVQLVGDDIFVTNPQRIWEGIEANCANAVVIKPNQIGTITETLQAIKLCKEYDRKIVVSHRSGETNDSFIADLAVGASAGQIKAGGMTQGERMAKYNRLLTIEDMLLLAS